MTKFNMEAAQAARDANPRVTVFDTGEMLEPHYQMEHYGPKVSYGARPDRKTGTVDFDNDEGGTNCTVFAHPSAVEDDTTLVQIDTLAGGRFKIMLNEAVLFNGNVEQVTTVEAMLTTYDQVCAELQALPESEREGRAYENYEDYLTEFAHGIVTALRSERTE